MDLNVYIKYSLSLYFNIESVRFKLIFTSYHASETFELFHMQKIRKASDLSYVAC